MKAIEPITGPSKSPKTKSRETSRGKRKAKPICEVEDIGPMDEEEFMRHQRIVERIVDKQVEIEMLWKEIEALEGMLEE